MLEENSIQNIEENEESKPDFELVDAKDFPWLDLNYYDRIAAEFQLEDFALIAQRFSQNHVQQRWNNCSRNLS
jgi:hypothetical protein